MWLQFVHPEGRSEVGWRWLRLKIIIFSIRFCMTFSGLLHSTLYWEIFVRKIASKCIWFMYEPLNDFQFFSFYQTSHLAFSGHCFTKPWITFLSFKISANPINYIPLLGSQNLGKVLNFLVVIFDNFFRILEFLFPFIVSFLCRIVFQVVLPFSKPYLILLMFDLSLFSVSFLELKFLLWLSLCWSELNKDWVMHKTKTFHVHI